MKIEFGKYVLTSEPYNLILSKKKIYKNGKKKGDEYLDTVGFFSSITTVGHALVELKIKKSDAESLDKLLQEVKEVKAEVAATIRRVVEEEEV